MLAQVLVVGVLFALGVQAQEWSLLLQCNGTMILPREGAGVIYSSSSNSLYIFGGTETGGGFLGAGYFDDVFQFELNTLNLRLLSTAQFLSPEPRAYFVIWQTSNVEFNIFGGHSSSSSYYSRDLEYRNDMWTFNILTQSWTFAGGDSVPNQPGKYTGIGISSFQNWPGSRSVAGSAYSGIMMWMFGGVGRDGLNNQGMLNDLWVWNGISWTWMSGSSIARQHGVYGTLNVPAILNVPGARQGSAMWSQDNSKIWIFGGFGIANTDLNEGFLNDLWCFDVTTRTWTWVAGSETAGSVGFYGSKNTPSVLNNPPARYLPAAWLDASGDLWLFGGTSGGHFNDLWKYRPSLGMWSWEGGSNQQNQAALNVSVGNPSLTVSPSARFGSGFAGNGPMFLFGGQGVQDNNTFGDLCDIWKLQVFLSPSITLTQLPSLFPSLPLPTVGLPSFPLLPSVALPSFPLLPSVALPSLPLLPSVGLPSLPLLPSVGFPSSLPLLPSLFALPSFGRTSLPISNFSTPTVSPSIKPTEITPGEITKTQSIPTPITSSLPSSRSSRSGSGSQSDSRSRSGPGSRVNFLSPSRARSRSRSRFTSRTGSRSRSPSTSGYHSRIPSRSGYHSPSRSRTSFNSRPKPNQNSRSGHASRSPAFNSEFVCSNTSQVRSCSIRITESQIQNFEKHCRLSGRTLSCKVDPMRVTVGSKFVGISIRSNGIIVGFLLIPSNTFPPKTTIEITQAPKKYFERDIKGNTAKSRSAAVDIVIKKRNGEKYSKLPGAILLALFSLKSGNKDAACLASTDENASKWRCEQRTFILKRFGRLVYGSAIDHLTSFAILLTGQSSGLDQSTPYWWISLICLGVAAILIVVICLSYEYIPAFRAALAGNEATEIFRVRRSFQKTSEITPLALSRTNTNNIAN